MKTSLCSLRALAACAVISLAACGSAVPQRASQWRDPALAAGSLPLRGQTVLVACEAWDLAMRENCQSSLVNELQTLGARPVASSADPSARGVDLDAQLKPEAAAAGAKAVLVVALTPAATGGGALSGASLGIGGFSWGGGGGGGIGIGVPIGGGGWGGSSGLAAQSRVSGVPTGRLMWASTFVSERVGDYSAQVRELAAAVVNAAHGDGLL